MGKIVQKQKEILIENIKRNLMAMVFFLVVTVVIALLGVFMKISKPIQIGGFIILSLLSFSLSLVFMIEFIRVFRIHRIIFRTRAANHDKTIVCSNVRFRTYSTAINRHQHADHIWAIVLIDKSKTKYTYILEEIKPCVTRVQNTLKQNLINKELVVLCYQNTNIIKKIRDINL